jgi:hypothetical protein
MRRRQPPWPRFGGTLMSAIFISYAREDRETAQRLAAIFDASGWSVWWDRELRAGRAFDRVIEEAITAASVVVVLWSRFSVLSDWVRAEAAFALETGKLLPLTLDAVAVPLRFRHIQSLSLQSWDGVSRDAPALLRLCTQVREQLAPPDQAQEGSLSGEGGVHPVVATSRPILVDAETSGAPPTHQEPPSITPGGDIPSRPLRQVGDKGTVSATFPMRVVFFGTLIILGFISGVTVLFYNRVSITTEYALYDVYIPGENVRGVNKNSKVTLNGIPVGQVSDMKVEVDNLDKVRITLEIAVGTVIKADCKAMIDFNFVYDTSKILISKCTSGAEALVAKQHERYPVIAFEPAKSSP